MLTYVLKQTIDQFNLALEEARDKMLAENLSPGDQKMVKEINDAYAELSARSL